MQRWRLAFQDFSAAIRQLDLVLFLTYSDLQARYRRSMLGPLWQTIGTAIGVIGLGLLWGNLFQFKPHEFVPHLATGLIIWQMLAGMVGDAPSCFIRQAASLRNLRLPYSLFPLYLVSRHLINLLHNLVILVVIYLWFELPLQWPLLLFPLALVVFVVVAHSFVLLLGMLGARLRDLEPTITTFLPLLFFITPVLYKPSQLSGHEWLVQLNPLTYVVELLRPLLLGHWPALSIVVGFLAGSIIIIVVAFAFFAARRHRLTYWL